MNDPSPARPRVSTTIDELSAVRYGLLVGVEATRIVFYKSFRGRPALMPKRGLRRQVWSYLLTDLNTDPATTRTETSR